MQPARLLHTRQQPHQSSTVLPTSNLVTYSTLLRIFYISASVLSSRPVVAGGTAALRCRSVPGVVASFRSAICSGLSTATGTRTASNVRVATVVLVRLARRSSPRPTSCSADEITSGIHYQSLDSVCP